MADGVTSCLAIVWVASPRLRTHTSKPITIMRPAPPPTAIPMMAPVDRAGELLLLLGEDVVLEVEGVAVMTVPEMELSLIPKVEQNEEEKVVEGVEVTKEAREEA